MKWIILALFLTLKIKIIYMDNMKISMIKQTNTANANLKSGILLTCNNPVKILDMLYVFKNNGININVNDTINKPLTSITPRFLPI